MHPEKKKIPRSILMQTTFTFRSRWWVVHSHTHSLDESGAWAWLDLRSSSLLRLRDLFGLGRAFEALGGDGCLVRHTLPHYVAFPPQGDLLQRDKTIDGVLFHFCPAGNCDWVSVMSNDKRVSCILSLLALLAKALRLIWNFKGRTGAGSYERQQITELLEVFLLITDPLKISAPLFRSQNWY